MPEYYTLSHAGIPGMKWHRRRWRNYDGSLTEAGKIRYGVGGDKAVKKAEKEKRRRDKILSDPKKLQKHASEFSTSELQNAYGRFEAINKLREQSRTEKLAEAKHKTDIANAKANTERQKAEAKSAKQRAKFDKLRFEAEEARKTADQERKVKRENKEAKTTAWKQRMLKLSNILTISKNGKEIFDELGVTDPKDGKTLFGSLGKAMGWDKKTASEVLGGSEKSEKSESAPKSESKPNSEPSSQNESESSSARGVKGQPWRVFAGWAHDTTYKDTTKKNLRSMERDDKAAYKEYVKNYNKEIAKNQKIVEKMKREDRRQEILDTGKSFTNKNAYGYSTEEAARAFAKERVRKCKDNIAWEIARFNTMSGTSPNGAAAKQARERVEKLFSTTVDSIVEDVKKIDRRNP